METRQRVALPSNIPCSFNLFQWSVIVFIFKPVFLCLYAHACMLANMYMMCASVCLSVYQIFWVAIIWQMWWPELHFCCFDDAVIEAWLHSRGAKYCRFGKPFSHITKNSFRATADYNVVYKAGQSRVGGHGLVKAEAQHWGGNSPKGRARGGCNYQRVAFSNCFTVNLGILCLRLLTKATQERPTKF